MRTVVGIVMVACLVVAPNRVDAQHGGRGFHGGGGGFGGGGGGFRGGMPGGGGAGRSMGMGGRPSMAAMPQRGGFARGPAHYNPHFSNRPGYHGGWYRGDWHGRWAGAWGYRPWGWGWYGGWGWGAPGWGIGVGWGLGGGVSVGIGMGSPWNWGYFGYYNPYWMGPMPGVTYINYAQPVVVAAPPPVQPAAAPMPANAPLPGYSPTPYAPPPANAPTPGQSQGLSILANAQALFRQGQYQAALNEANRAAASLPNDSLVHEFRALCLFALRDYQQAAAAVHAIVSVGPGWNWATVSNLYGTPTAYADQLRALERYCEDQPNAAAPRFLLAYHYLLAEHNTEAATVLEDVVRLEPKDQLAAQLLKGLRTPGDKSTPVTPPKPAGPVDRERLLGHWRANRTDGSEFDLDLTDDGKFRWHFKQQEHEQQFSGTFTLASNFLILAASDQNTLIGQVSMEQDDKLNFRLAGGNPSEPGLTFTR
jgi:hypothetical protein